MPKLKPATLEARRDQILAAAERCFAREGFHQTTIQDVIAESGLSAGGIYVHFRSKDDLIAAIAEARHARDARLLSIPAGEDPLGALVDLARAFMGDLDSPEGGRARRVGLQVWAEALRNPVIRDQVVEGVQAPVELISALLRRGIEQGQVRADVSPPAVARILVALFHGFTLQRLWEEPLDREASLAAYKALLDGLRP